MGINCKLSANDAFAERFEGLKELAGKNKVAKKALADFEVTAMNEVQAKLKDFAAKYGKDTEKFRKKTQEYLNTIRKTKIERRIEMIDTATRKSRFAQDHIDGDPGTNLGDALEGMVVGSKKGHKGAADSVDSRASVHVGEAQNYLHSNFTGEQLKILSSQNSLADQNRMRMALEYMDEFGNIPESAMLKHGFQLHEVQFAKALRDYTNFLHKKQVDAGADIGKLDNFSVSQNYDYEKISLANREEVIDLLLKENVLQEKTFANLADFTDPKTGKLVTKAEQAREIAGKMVDGWKDKWRENSFEFDLAKADTQGRSSMSARLEKNRKLHFTPEGSVEFFSLYGGKSLGESMLGSAQTIGRKVAMLEVFGKNPAATFNGIRQMSADHVRTKIIAAEKSLVADPGNKKIVKQIKKLEKEITKIEHSGVYFENAMGFNKAPTNNIFDDGVNAINNLTYISKLGTSGFAAINDVATMIAVTSARTGKSPLKGSLDVVSEIAKGSAGAFGEVFSRKGTAQFMQELSEYGFALDAAMGAYYRSMGIDPNSRGAKMGAAMANFHEVVNPLGIQLLFHKHVAVSLVSSDLGRQIKGRSLNPSSLRTLERVGLTKEYMPMLKQMVESNDTVSMLNPASYKKVTDDVANQVLTDLKAKDPTINLTPEQIKRDVQRKLGVMYQEMASDAAPTSGAKEQVLLNLGTTEGTKARALTNLIKPLKSISVKMLSVTQGLYHANPNKAKAMGDLSQNLMIGAGIAYLSISMKEMAKGRTPPDLNNPETIKNVMAYSGYGGIYLDLALQMSGGSGRSPLDSIAGPSVGTVLSAGKLVSKGVKGDLEEKDLLNFASGNVPLANHFLFRPAADAIFLEDWMNSADPGRQGRKRKRMRDAGQEDLWR